MSYSSKDIALFQRDWDLRSFLNSSRNFSRKTLPCSKGIETLRLVLLRSIECRKTLPCSKGIETLNHHMLLLRRLGRKTLPCSKGIETSSVTSFTLTAVSKDIALFQRDWDLYPSCLIMFFSRKTLPCSKGIETGCLRQHFQDLHRRKTLPCSKGIETLQQDQVYQIQQGRKTLPCSKGIETNVNRQ